MQASAQSSVTDVVESAILKSQNDQSEPVETREIEDREGSAEREMEKEDTITGSESDSEPEASARTVSDLLNDLGQWSGINTAV